jgi:hypothetical protein
LFAFGAESIVFHFLSKNTKIKISRTIILPVVLCGCETWSLSLREERRLRVLENKMLRRKFGLKRKEVIGEWRKLHTEELNDLYCSPNIVQVIKSGSMRWAGKSGSMRWAGHVVRMGRVEIYMGFWWGNLRERDHLEDPGIDEKIILRWIFRKWDQGMDWIDVAQVVGTCECGYETWGFHKMR